MVADEKKQYLLLIPRGRGQKKTYNLLITIKKNYQTQPNGKFFETVRQYKERDFGVVTIDRVSLITTNSVADSKHTKLILLVKFSQLPIVPFNLIE